MANPFVHVELNTTDVAKAKAFYGKLFEWKLEDVPMGPGATYTMIEVGEGTGGGLMKHPVPGAASAWLAYVLVDDIGAATEKARALGATVAKDVTEVPGAGWFSVIVDSDGRRAGPLEVEVGPARTDLVRRVADASRRRARPVAPGALERRLRGARPADLRPDLLQLPARQGERVVGRADRVIRGGADRLRRELRERAPGVLKRAPQLREILRHPVRLLILSSVPISALRAASDAPSPFAGRECWGATIGGGAPPRAAGAPCARPASLLGSIPRNTSWNPAATIPATRSGALEVQRRLVAALEGKLRLRVV